MHAPLQTDNLIVARARTRAGSRAFSIVELLVVMAVIGVLALLTTLGARRLTSGSRLAAGTNAVTSALANARAAAIRDSAPTALVFRVTWDPTKPFIPQRTEMVTMRSTGEQVITQNTETSMPVSKVRMRPVADIPAIVLPEGVKVAGPIYNQTFELGADSVPSYKVWSTQGDMVALAACSESLQCSQQIAVLFGADGAFLTRPPRASVDDAVFYADDNNDGVQHSIASPTGFGSCASGNYQLYWLQDNIFDEPNLLFVPFLSVYDDRAARDAKASNWSNITSLVSELTGPSGYISQFGDKITFNRFSGLPERKVR